MVKTYIRHLMRSIGVVKIFIAVLIVPFSVGTTFQASAAEPFSDSLSGWIEVPIEDRLSIGDFYEESGSFTPWFTTVHGSIKNKWNELGGEDGDLGSTVVGEQETPDGTGRFAIFERGLIYWSPASGAVEITGGMLAQWVEDPEWWFGKMGFPVSSMRKEDGRWVQTFQHGMMYAASARPPWASCGGN